MKRLIPIWCLLLVACTNNHESTVKSPTETAHFDSIKAQQYGADQYGMKMYIMAFLKKGPNRDQDSAEADRLQRAHMDNINRLAGLGKLIIAGPFMDDSDIRGIYIFNVQKLSEAKALTATDPAIKAGRLVMELHPWYGPAGLMALDSIQQRISKTKI